MPRIFVPYFTRLMHRFLSNMYWQCSWRTYVIEVMLSHPFMRVKAAYMRARGIPCFFIIGESNAKYTFKGISPVIRLPVGPFTMHRIGRDGLRDCFLFHEKRGLWPNKFLKKGDTVFFSFGEIDCRCHIAQQIAAGRKEEEVLATLVTRYIDALRNARKEGVKFCVISVMPPAYKKYIIKYHTLKPSASDEERARYTTSINVLLREKTAQNGFVYLDMHSPYSDEKGMLNYGLSDGLTHIGDISNVRKIIAARPDIFPPSVFLR